MVQVRVIIVTSTTITTVTVTTATTRDTMIMMKTLLTMITLLPIIIMITNNDNTTRPRSNPDGIGITLGCVDWGSGARPSVVVKTYDGVHWERSHKETGIALESKEQDGSNGGGGGGAAGAAGGGGRSPSRGSVVSSYSEHDVEL